MFAIPSQRIHSGQAVKRECKFNGEYYYSADANSVFDDSNMDRTGRNIFVNIFRTKEVNPIDDKKANK